MAAIALSSTLLVSTSLVIGTTMKACGLVVAVVAAALASPGGASTVDHRYTDGEHVELWVNKVRQPNQSLDCTCIDSLVT